jgi:L-ascorbate metabolism protein UlaG (beta-lactamase superfamily)
VTDDVGPARHGISPPRHLLRLTWLGHATVLIQLGGTRLLSDPVLRETVGPLRRRRDIAAVARPAPVDGILLSHLHHDHADLPSLRALGAVPVLTDPVNARWARRRRLVAPDVAPGAWHDVTDEVQVRLVPAEHRARPMPHRPNAAVGMLVRGLGRVLWFAGDTSVYPEMARLPDLAGAPVDVALLPVGGWGPRLSAGHMGPEEAAEAAALVGARAVVPIHYGTLHPRGWPRGRLAWTSAPVERLPGAVAARSGAAVHVLEVGQSIRLP